MDRAAGRKGFRGWFVVVASAVSIRFEINRVPSACQIGQIRWYMGTSGACIKKVLAANKMMVLPNKRGIDHIVFVSLAPVFATLS